MAWPVYSTQFLAGYVGSAVQANALIYTVPAGKVAVVRSIDVFASTPGNVFCGRVVAGLVLPFVSSAGLPVYQTRHFDGDQVLIAGQQLKCQWLDGVICVVASGFVLNALG